MDSYVRGIEMKLSIKQTNTQAHRPHKCWIKPALQWTSEKRGVRSLMNDWIWPSQNPWSVVERSFISSLDVKMGSSNQEKKRAWVSTYWVLKIFTTQCIRLIIKRASLTEFWAVTEWTCSFRPGKPNLKNRNNSEDMNVSISRFYGVELQKLGCGGWQNVLLSCWYHCKKDLKPRDQSCLEVFANYLPSLWKEDIKKQIYFFHF